MGKFFLGHPVNNLLSVALCSRRVLRDISERGRDLENVLLQYTTLVKPAFEEFCIPTKKYADVIIPRGAENLVALDLIKQHIEVSKLCRCLSVICYVQDIIWKSSGESRQESPWSRSRSCSDSSITR